MTLSSWFQSLKKIVNEPVHTDTDSAPDRLAEAAAVLLLEMAAMDQDMGASELEAVHRAMAAAFGMDAEAIEEVVAQAGDLQRQSVSLHRFTERLRTEMGNRQRIDLVRQLWRVAYADGHLHHYEEHLLRRLAELLGVPHGEFVRTRLEVAGAGGS